MFATAFHASELVAEDHPHQHLHEIERRAFLTLAAMAATLVARNPLRRTINDLISNRPLPPPAAGWAASSDDLAQWQSFQRRFITGDGRVVDTGNGGISHSEGQSYAMLFATWANDPAGFAQVWDWTREHLTRPSDHLLAWRYRPAQANPVDDLNDATDANLTTALALMRAGARWDNPHYVAQAIEIAHDILGANTVRIGQRTYLKPASSGFVHRGELVLNPSYYNFVALRAMASLVPDARWQALEHDGMDMLRQARFGHWSLPADWVTLATDSGQFAPAKAWAPKFSWDAIRVPLNLIWSGAFDSEVVRDLMVFWSAPSFGGNGALVDLETGNRTAMDHNSGISAVAALTRMAATRRSSSLGAFKIADAPSYYDASLMLLSRIAAQESGLNDVQEVPISQNWLASLV